MSPLPAPPPDQLVTSSDLVRHFGLWQERATRAPLYILHRGRPRFVLTSIETMEALCAPHARGAAAPAQGLDSTPLLDSIGDLVLVAGDDGAIVASSRAARAHFGGLSAPGAPIDAIAQADARPMLAEAIRRVIAWGIGDRLEMRSAAREARTLLLTIEPAGTGVLIVAQDGGRDAARAAAADQARDAALHAAGLASATIDLRGYVVDPAPALVALTGLDRATLAQTRFAALAETSTQDALVTALEAAFAGAGPAALDAALLVDQGEALTVRIGLAPIRGGAGITGIAAVVAPR